MTLQSRIKQIQLQSHNNINKVKYYIFIEKQSRI